MHDSTYNDDIQFDRLVDGELSDDERRRLLESLDTRPDGWRRCALAFLEAQTWGHDFADLIPRSTEANVAAKQVSTDKQWSGHGAAWLAIAAGLLVAATFGLLRHNSGPNGDPPNGQIADGAPPVQSPDGAKADDSVTLWVNDANGQRRSLRVPLVDASTIDPKLGMQFQTGVPDDVRAELRNRGYDVQSKRRYAPLQFDNGAPMYVPVEDTQIIPVNQKVY